ncbi:MAG: hypothetical protein MI919_01035, partial [Holophagales bacterium]|nr:hypothetical protein [Holophagales bacterium]
GTVGSPEVWIQSDRPLDRLELQLGSPFDSNPTRLRLGSDVRNLDISGEPRTVVFEPNAIYGAGEADVRRRERRPDDYSRFLDLWLYRLEVEAQRGGLPRWAGRAGPYFDHGISLRVLAAEPQHPPAAADVSE